MGTYLNPDSLGFKMSLNSEIYVDKTGLIAKTSAKFNTHQRYLCISRPRRFGKSMAADMLSAYYAYGQDSRSLFDGLAISKDATYKTHLNQYNVLKINMQFFLSLAGNIDDLLETLQSELLGELREAFGTQKTRFALAMSDVFSKTKRQFVILIDEWDCLFREYRDDRAAQTKYLDFLRMWLKDQPYIAMAYMTGILPIKKYGTHSALNMFTEYSMTDPGDLAEYFGFTEAEVHVLCDQYGANFEEAKAWYDGYELTDDSWKNAVTCSMYNPKSVVESLMRRRYGTYWNQTETYEALKVYIQLNMDGLKDSVVRMLAGDSVPIDISGFENDMTTFARSDDVLTLLVHLGYLTYHARSKTVTIPNKEVAQVYVTSILRMPDWKEVADSVEASRELLEALLSLDSDAVAAGIDRAHNEISVLQYNNENALSCTVTLAFLFARKYYTVVRECPAGKGFADVCFIPRPAHADKPAVIVELKWNQSAEGAITQIKEKRYVDALKNYRGNLLLAGINYDRESKKHSCAIEQWQI